MNFVFHDGTGPLFVEKVGFLFSSTGAGVLSRNLSGALSPSPI